MEIICIECGRNIPKERIVALPGVKICIDCMEEVVKEIKNGYKTVQQTSRNNRNS